MEVCGVEVGMVGAGGREWRLVKLRRGIMSRETGTFFFDRGEVPKKSSNKDNTVKSSVEFEKLSPQSGIVRWADWVESKDHMEVNGWR